MSDDASNKPDTSDDSRQVSQHIQSTAECCAHGGADGESVAADIQTAFGSFAGAVMGGGVIDPRTTELINFALVVMARCEPCVKLHMSKARKMGISQEELDEAAWCATLMGGAPARMFYLEQVRKNSTDEAPGCCS